MQTVLVLFSLLAVAAWGPDAVAAAAPRTPSDLLRLETSVSLAARRNDAICLNRTTTCADCRRVNVCGYLGSGYVFLYTNTCPDSAPYCKDGQCVQSADDCALPARADDFYCANDEEYDGYYPAPRDCTKFYVCSGGVAYVYNCPAGHVYSHAVAGCVRSDLFPQACYTFPGCGQDVQYLLYQPDPSVYAVCRGFNWMMLSRCPPSYRIDPLKPEEPCRPFCERQGRVADEYNPRAYYDCNLVAPGGSAAGSNCTSCAAPGVLSDPVRQYCPPDMHYAALHQRCVADTDDDVVVKE